MADRSIFLAGASGAVGRTILRVAPDRGIAITPHYRRAPEAAPAGALVFPLEDRARLVEALRGRTTVVQCIGTIRKRFSSGDTYETSDIGTTEQLVAAAREAGTVDHLVLLSSVGAGRPVGAYLKAKARAESIVTESGIPFTIFRPSAFDGEGHRAPPGSLLFSKIPGLGSFRPIEVTALARAIAHVAWNRAPIETVLEGVSLFRVVDESSRN